MQKQAPKLVIMAAGMGSRFGGLKQMEPVDREGHSIIDFSMYDARRAGFRDLVFIIKRERSSGSASGPAWSGFSMSNTSIRS